MGILVIFNKKKTTRERVINVHHMWIRWCVTSPLDNNIKSKQE